MDDIGRIDGMKKLGGNWRTARKPTEMVFVHHKAHVAQVGIEPKTTNTPKVSALLLNHRGPVI